MKRKFLEDLGLEKEIVDTIMDANGSDVESLKAERDRYRQQLSDAQTKLKSFEGVDVQDLKGQIKTLTTDLETKDREFQEKLAERDFEDALKGAIASAGARNAKAVMALLDRDSLKASKNQKEDIQKALDAVKKDNDYLFQPDKPVPKIVSSTPGASPMVEDKKTQANEAIRSLFGKE
jgi:DNA repair exonuclease SbcCD ATPase subunit